MNRTTILNVILFLILITPITLFAQNNDAAKRVIERIIGSRANDITFESIPQKDGKDGYAISCSNGKLTIKGSSPTAITYAFSQYLRKACNSMVTWSGSNITIPSIFPNYSCDTKYSPYSLRYFLNVCTFGYTTQYWDWKRWEKEIDLMALHGVNMPLASVASEAIAERVWLKMGLNKNEIRQFFTGASYLPWHRMGNLNTWDGPLSDAWMKSQLELQHKIINRMQELGMMPVANAFAGFVPESFTSKHPEIKCKHLEWGGFDDSMNAYVLPPDSPYFQEIGKLFIQEWEKEFGKNKYYLSDSFNEMELPINPNDKDEKYRLLSHYGESIYQSITAGNPDAIWVTQGWTFGYQHKFWDKKSLSSLLEKVPNEKMLIIDLGNDYPKWVWHTEQTWKNHDGFYGKQWIFSYVPNFGGKTLLTGDLSMYATSSAQALAAPNKCNLVGFGSAPEGLENNEIVYELLGDMGWTPDSINLDSWLESYCKSRYGDYPAAMKSAWKGLHNSVYSSLYSYPRFTWQTVFPDKRRKSLTDLNDTYMKAVEDFLACAPQLKCSELYRNDAIQFAAQYIGAKADILYVKALHLDSIGNSADAKKLLSQSINLLQKADRLLASHPNDKLSNWINTARNQGTTTEEKDKYESDAKRIITTWGGFQEDYAARYWNGLIKNYYIPRMLIYFSSNRNNLDTWEENWINTPSSYVPNPYTDPVGEAVKIINQIKNL